jgi:hypothetical protein
MSEQSGPDGERLEPDQVGDTAARPDVPRWVMTLGLVLAAMIVIMLIVMATRGGQHGPGRHRPSTLGSAGAAVPATSLAAGHLLSS